jgi:MinD superfamily P-loop ATPase
MDKPYEIVVLSGKGGTGKTSITAAFASFAENAVFADCDVDAANLHLVLSPDTYKSEYIASGAKARINPENCTACGLCTDLCRFNAIHIINNKYAVDEFACEGCGLCAIVCLSDAIRIEKYEKNQLFLSTCRFGPMIHGKLGIAEENSGKLVSKIRQHAQTIARENKANYILIDGPPGIGCPAISSVTGTDLVIAVTEPTLSGWHDLQRLIEMIESFQTALLVIINKYDLNSDMANTIETNLKMKDIPVADKIPFYEPMIYSLLEGKTIPEFEPQGKVSKQLNTIWNNIIIHIHESKSI